MLDLLILDGLGERRCDGHVVFPVSLLSLSLFIVIPVSTGRVVASRKAIDSHVYIQYVICRPRITHVTVSPGQPLLSSRSSCFLSARFGNSVEMRLITRGLRLPT